MQSGLFPPQTHISKLGNELALDGQVSAKKGGVFRRKLSLVLFCSFRKQLRLWPKKKLLAT